MSGGSTQSNAVTAAYYRGYAKACEDARRDLMEPGHAHLLEAAEILRLADSDNSEVSIERHHAWLERDDKLPPAPDPSTPAAKAGDGWIRCSERMPPAGEMVQFHVPGYPARARFVGYWSDRFERFEDLTDCDRDGDPREHYNATHWQPLPAHPKPSEGSDGE